MALLGVKLLHLLLGILAIGVVVLIHEAGHFLMSRLLKVDVEVFSVGMGPCLISFHGRKTEYRISAIPFGGYCRMKGSIDLTKALRDEAKSFNITEHGSYFATSPFVRFLIFFAGPLTNLLLSLLLFIIIAFLPVETIANEAKVLLTSDYNSIYHTKALQDELKSGDIILSLDGNKISSYEEAEEYLIEHKGESFKAEVLRGDEIKSILIKPTETEGGVQYGITLYQKAIVGRTTEQSDFKSGDIILSVDGNKIENTNDFYLYAHSGSEIELLRDNQIIKFIYKGSNLFPFAWANRVVLKGSGSFTSAIKDGFKHTKESIVSIIDSLVKLFSGKAEDARNEITGPTRAAQTIGNITVLGFETSIRSGIRALLYLSSIVSLSLFIANMLPIPSFDGGGMLLSLAQIIIGHELTPKAYVYFQIIGLVASLIIIVLMYSLDIKHYFFT